MIIRYRNEAVEEFIESVKYYNSQRSGLGFEFASEVRKTVSRIKKYLESWPMISSNVRKCLINRFPFTVLWAPLKIRFFIIITIKKSNFFIKSAHKGTSANQND